MPGIVSGWRDGAAVEYLGGRLLLRLSFAARADWVRVEAQGLRCSWRLIEHAPAVIEQVLERAMAALPQPLIHADLFAAA